jgi:hypothetical protein
MDAAAVAAALFFGLQMHSTPGHHLATAQAAPRSAAAARVLEADERKLEASNSAARTRRQARLHRVRETRRSVLEAQRRRRQTRLAALQGRAADGRATAALKHRASSRPSSPRPRHASNGHARRELQRERRRERAREAHERHQRVREAHEGTRQAREQAREQARVEHREARERRRAERHAAGIRGHALA